MRLAERERYVHAKTAILRAAGVEALPVAIQLPKPSARVGEADAARAVVTRRGDGPEITPLINDAQTKNACRTPGANANRPRTYARRDPMPHRVLEQGLQQHGGDCGVLHIDRHIDIHAKSIAEADPLDVQVTLRELQFVP
jgi:hypothetical protein